jgi:hypothetical protein
MNIFICNGNRRFCVFCSRSVFSFVKTFKMDTKFDVTEQLP